MIEKLSLEEFRKIKEELLNLVKNFEEEIDENLFNKDYDENLKEEEFEDKYFKVQNKLLSYDLSEIPFEEWKGIEIHSDDNSIADFSNTHANIDFSLINLDNYFASGSFKGCNIRNLKDLDYMIDEKNFDNITIQNNSSLFLSNIFPKDFKDKYYNSRLNIEDLEPLSSEQLLELKKKKVIEHLDRKDRESFIKNLITVMIGIDKSIELYNYSKKDYNYVLDILEFVNKRFSTRKFEPSIDSLDVFIEKQIINSDVKDIKSKFNSYLREFITKLKFSPIVLEDIPKDIINNNEDLFLVDESIKEILKEKFYNRKLNLIDVLYNLELFDNIPIENFLKSGEIVTKELGYGNLVNLMKKHYDVFRKILLNADFYDFSHNLSRYSNYNIERKFTLAVKAYYNERYIGTKPDWLRTMNFNFVGKLLSAKDLMEYDDNTLVEDVDQQKVINVFGIENLKKLEEETKIFSSSYLEFDIFRFLSECVDSHYRNINLTNRFDDLNFKSGMLPYKAFRDKFAKYLDILRANNIFSEYDNYDFIKGEFRKDYSEIFIDRNAPLDLKNAFYSNNITPKFLFENKEYIPYLVDKNLLNVLKMNMRFVRTSNSGLVKANNFIEKYIEIFGNKKTLKLVSKYGDVLNNIEINYDFLKDNSGIDEKLIDKAVKDAIYKKIKFECYDYLYLKNVKDFTSYHPEIFANFDSIKNIDEDEKKDLEKRYYTQRLVYDDIKEHPELIEILKDKDLDLCFHEYDKPSYVQDGMFEIIKSVKNLDLILAYGNQNFLKLCHKYGRYLKDMAYELNKELIYKNKTYYLDETKKLSFEEIDKKIEEIIINRCFNGEINYDEDAPEFLKKNHPELFLSDDAPEDLKIKFYCRNLDLTFCVLSILYNDKRYRPYLEGKKVSAALLKNTDKRYQIKHFFKFFGEDTAIKLGINKWETVQEMLGTSKINLMKRWYDKTGAKFIPDYVVMQNIPLEESDKFLSNGSKWSKLMKLKEFSNSYESIDAMLKLAYSFGVFEGDIRGFNKLYELLIRIPKQINEKYKPDIEIINKEIAGYVPDFPKKFDTKKDVLNTIIERMSNDNFIRYKYGGIAFIDLMIGIRDENIDIDFSLPVFSQIYKLNKDGSYSLKINSKNCPKTTEAIKNILNVFEENEDLHLLSALKAHQLFGGFKLEYNPEFREFLLDNLDEILSNDDYQTYISSIQRQFNNIKIANSNRKLTLDLAISYVQQNRYDDVELGNESVAEVSAIAGYDQEDFDTLQKIYNYGKQRIFSSIPRIEGNNEKYTYEMLRLDDPLAMAIGTLTDCCQELNNVAEVCMEHSMVDKNGRVFIIKDKEGNIVSQSWVWRNGNVLCFDNIEIPNKAFSRVDNRKNFTEEVHEIYKKASEELVKKDEEAYKNLFDEGKISKEEYEGLKLKKVTVGIGYNDIAETLKRNSNRDYSTLGPREFNPPVDLDRNLYTSDSITQYILKDDDRVNSFSGQAYTPHNDLYKIYDDSNFTKNELIRLGKLEINQSEYSDILDVDKEENIVSEIADLYDLDKEKTKVIMNANFAIIYEDDDKIKIADLFYNLKAGNMDIENVVAMQIRLAIEQIKSNKEIDISQLDNNQKTLYNKAMNLNEEIDIEKGIIKNKIK